MQELFSGILSFPKSPMYDEGMKKDVPSEVGKRIAVLRQAIGLTQRQLAEKLEQPQSNIAYWESRAPAPPGEVLPALARVLGISVDELLGVKQVERKPVVARGKLQQIFEQASRLPRRQQQKVADILSPFVKEHAAVSS